MACEYVRQNYGVPAEIGRRVTVNGKPGVIAEDLGHHLGVLFDEDKPGDVLPCHPTWRVKYLDMGPIRKLSKSKMRSKARYRRYLEFGDCFDSFLEFCRWDALPDRSWH